MADVSRSDETRSGCGILYAVFGRNKLWSTRSGSSGALPSKTNSSSSLGSSKRRRNGFRDEKEVPSRTPQQQQMPRRPQPQQGQQMPRRPPGQGQGQGQVQVQGQKKQPQPQRQPQTTMALGISGELENIIAEHQRGATSAGLLRASSGNVMLYGHLGNLRQPPAAKELHVPTKNVNGDVNKKVNNNTMCRAISCRMDPEELKILGNEDYKNGRFAEALALYERAIDMDPTKASYRSNKSAALTALGRLLEAALECREAIQIDPHYHRAHHRLANLYLRLGDADKALFHFNKAGGEADPDAIANAKLLLSHLNKCHHAKRIGDWNALINATNNAISAGADSAPNVFGLQAEAFLRLHRHEDAESAIRKGPTFDIEQSIKLLGAAASAAFLLIRAQVDMACGRLEEAVWAAERAGQVDPRNREVGAIRGRARSVALARAHGNQLFRASKFGEAATAYSEGLQHDPYNAVLLCNRAACLSKLGHHHKALHDCNAALKLLPSYHKARLRRAHCYSELGNWEIAIQDYEILIRDSPQDEDLRRALLEAQTQLNKNGSRGKQVEADAHELLESSIKESAASCIDS